MARKAEPSRPPPGTTPAPLPQAPLDDAQRLACLRLIRSENIGPVTFRELINRFGGAAQALDALPELSRRGGRGKPLRICSIEAAETELEAARSIGAQPLFTIEPDYPPLLAHLEMPPPMVYAKGRRQLLTRPAVALVGSRDASAAGRTMARSLASDLGRAGLVIVSGLARGIDAEAHAAALPTGTVAVLAGGVDMIYPPENADLYAQITAQGCVVSEMPPGFVARGQDFPRRNRIVSGISSAVIVIEAAKRSGTLITARTAAEQGREVFAVPGHPLDPRAEGTNDLLKSGATMVTTAADVLDALGPELQPRFSFRETSASGGYDDIPDAPQAAAAPSHQSTGPPPDLDGARRQVYDILGPTPVSIDELVRVTRLPVRSVQAALLELALAGRIERHGLNLVSRTT